MSMLSFITIIILITISKVPISINRLPAFWIISILLKKIQIDFATDSVMSSLLHGICPSSPLTRWYTDTYLPLSYHVSLKTRHGLSNTLATGNICHAERITEPCPPTPGINPHLMTLISTRDSDIPPRTRWVMRKTQIEKKMLKLLLNRSQQYFPPISTPDWSFATCI